MALCLLAAAGVPGAPRGEARTPAGPSASDRPSTAGPPSTVDPPSAIRKLLDDGDYKGAEALARRRLAQTESASGPRSLATARALDDLAEALWRLGDGADPGARRVGDRALEIKESLLGPDDGRLAASLRNLAILSNQNGDYPKAQALFERALRVCQRVHGPDSPEAAQYLDNLGIVLRQEGDYPAARDMSERALAIKKGAGNARTETVANTAGNLAATLALMGDYEGARRLFEESLSIREEVLPPDHPNLLLSLDNLAELLIMAGDLKAARPLEERALRLRQARLGPDHFHVALSLANMGHLEVLSGHKAAALDDLRRALAIREQDFGPDHPWVAKALDALGEARARFGDARGARADFERALRVQDRTLDARHPERARTIADLAQSLLALGEPTAAFERGLEAARLTREHFRAAAQALSQADALRYARERGAGLDVALTVATTDRVPRSSHGVARIWDEIVRSRAMVLDEMASRHRYVAGRADGDVARRAEDLNAARARLAGLLGRIPRSGDLQAYRAQVERAYEEKEAAERDLAEASAPFRRQWKRSRADLAKVLGSLPAGSALLAYVQYRVVAGPDRAPVPSYAALVAAAGGGEPVLIPLGGAEEIDSLVATWQREAGSDPRQRGPAADAWERYVDAGARLRRRIWDPVAPHLGETALLVVVPDGSLNLVSLATLPLPDGRFLLEEGPVLHYVSSERDLVPSTPAPERRTGLLALGAIDYGPGPRGASPAAGLPRGHTPDPGCPDLSSLRFAPLAATADEVHDVAALAASSKWFGGPGNVRELLGAAADEAAFKAEAGHFGVLHLASHAYFVDDRCGSDPAWDARAPGPRPDRAAVAPTLPVLQDPLLRSGLALAGANGHSGSARAGDGDDGLLTAEEIASLDLSGVRWAVLSGCRTGVGSIRDGEGVLGLRRAFAIAGAGTLIMSLWRVEDEATLLWMKALYQARAGGLSTAASVRRASLDLLAAQRRRGRTLHPFYWGAFIAAGDWR